MEQRKILDFFKGLKKILAAKCGSMRILSWAPIAFSFILFIISIVFAFSLNESANLEVRHDITATSETHARLTMYVKNNAIFKETGRINFYRLDVSHFKPHLQINESLKPGKNKTFGFEILIDKKNITIEQKRPKPPAIASCTIPRYKLYFATEKDIAIFYKVACDNCRNEGIVRRIPDFDKTLVTLALQDNNDSVKCSGYVTTYNWVEFGLDEI